MRCVFKYLVTEEDAGLLMLPMGAEILAVQLQGDALQLWAIVNPDQPKVPRRIRIAGTGHPIVDDNLRFISTFQLEGGALVFHAFEVL